jgi:hypothetical protein
LRVVDAEVDFASAGGVDANHSSREMAATWSLLNISDAAWLQAAR